MREPKSNSWIFVVSIVIVFQLTISVCLAQKHQPNTQEIGVTSYSLDHGLNEDYIKCTAQDSSGYIYVGTRNGLFKFDSYTFTRINLFKSTAKATLVHFIHVDQQGNVWVGTNKGIKRKKAKESQFESIPKLNYRIITSIYQEDENQFWLGTAYNNLASYNLKKDTVILYPIPNRYNLSTLMPVDDELMFIGLKRKGGVFFNRSSKDIINNSSSQIPRSNIENTIKSKTGRIFATCRGRLYELVNNRFIDLDIKQSLPENNAPAQLLSLLEYNDSTLWIGTDGNGLIAYNINNGLASSLKLKTSVPVNAITHLFKDKAGAVWISTTNAGLLVNDPYKSEFTHWIYEKGNPTGLSANSVLGIEQLSNSKIILGLDGGGINIYNERTNTFNHFINSKRNKNVVRDVFKDSKNNIWVGGFRDGLKLFKPNKRNHYTYPIKIEKAPFNNSVKCFSEDYKGRIWIGTGERGVIISNYPNDNNSTEYLKAYSNNLITSLYESSDSTMWIGKINGLSKYNPHLNKFQDVNLGGGNTPPIHVLSITESEKHQIWVGTQIGLWHIDEMNKDTILYSTADGLPSSIVNGVLSDDNGDIWAATAHGLSQYKVGNEIFRNFGLVDGIKGQFSDNSALKASDGKLYFGGTNGVYSFYPEQIKHNPTPPTIQLVEMAIFTLNKGHEDALSNYKVIDLHNTNEIILNHDQNIFSISFTALNYTLSRNNKYKYQLVGFEEGWNTTKDQRKITYTRIPPGDYEFKVIAANNDGVWNNRGKSIKIKIKSPWYKTNTALIIWFLIILALIITINRFVILQMKLKNSLQMERMDKKMQEEANLNKIQFFTNITHELRSPLTLILGPLDKLITNAKPNSSNLKNLGLIKKNADRLLRLINQILEFRKIDQGKRKVKVSMVNIVLFIREICDSFIELSNSKSITIVFTPHFDVLNLYVDTGMMEMIISNLLSNAIKYSSHDTEINVDVTIDNATKMAIITVKDMGNGITHEDQSRIFERFYRVNDNSTSGTGIGLSLTKSMVEMMHGEISVESAIGKGSLFTVKLPLGNAHYAEDELEHQTTSKVLNTSETRSKPGTKFAKLLNDSTPVNAQKELINNSKYKVLVIDDEEDIRQFIADGLSLSFQVFQATDGEDGYNKIIDIEPDLVISDVLMPKMTGLELCKKIKSDLTTSHIPIILLTSLTSDTQHLHGLEAGADDYITKPFNQLILLHKANNIIEYRKKIIKRFKTEVAMEPKEMTSTSGDEVFIEKTIEIVKANISDSSFKVDQLIEELGMSRSPFFRKIKALAGMAPSDFIRTIRLKQAAMLLSQNDRSISEVAYDVGFTSPKHFRECFKKQFEQTPSEYTRAINN